MKDESNSQNEKNEAVFAIVKIGIWNILLCRNSQFRSEKDSLSDLITSLLLNGIKILSTRNINCLGFGDFEMNKNLSFSFE